jgi:hypothetical protein
MLAAISTLATLAAGLAIGVPVGYALASPPRARPSTTPLGSAAAGGTKAEGRTCA